MIAIDTASKHRPAQKATIFYALLSLPNLRLAKLTNPEQPATRHPWTPCAPANTHSRKQNTEEEEYRRGGQPTSRAAALLCTALAVSATPFPRRLPHTSQQALAERAPHERAAGPHRVISGAVDLGRQRGVDLDQVDGDEAAGLVHALADEVALAQRQPASNRRARGRRPHGVERVDVERQVDGRVGADVRERHVHDAPDAVSALPPSA